MTESTYGSTYHELARIFTANTCRPSRAVELNGLAMRWREPILSEQELRDSLRSAVVDEPPMTFDLDELMVTAERLARRRRIFAVVGEGPTVDIDQT
ncbi:hypothetical protein [Kibdelosporangium philippinense]|uniref:hypothetical protein n=1 Tax=Kibdelosporangium philippinense TaxID=211113 RepID=UPI003623CA9A